MVDERMISSLDELWDIISDQRYDDKINRYRSSKLYRGLPRASYHLKTTLSRNSKGKAPDVEEPILRNFAKYASIDDPNLDGSVWRRLIVGQHHGLPTRLLDWTYSPLVAFHFATSGESLAEMETDDCAVWAIDIEEINSLLPPSYQDMLRSRSAYLFTVDMMNELVGSLEEYDEDMREDSMVLLEPPSIDQRIISQYSYFSVIPTKMLDVEGFLERRTNSTVKYVIDRSLKWRVRDMLDQMNINERVAFPGLDGLASWLKRHYYVK